MKNLSESISNSEMKFKNGSRIKFGKIKKEDQLHGLEPKKAKVKNEKAPKLLGWQAYGMDGKKIGPYMPIDQPKKAVKGKTLEQALLDRILYVGEELPDGVAQDKRPKFVLLGSPAELIKEVKI